MRLVSEFLSDHLLVPIQSGAGLPLNVRCDRGLSGFGELGRQVTLSRYVLWPNADI